MKPTKKVLLFSSISILVMVTIACSCGPLSSLGIGSTPGASQQSTSAQGGQQLVEATTSAPAIVPSSRAYADHATAQVDIPAGQSGSAVAACPSSSLLIAGGFTFDKGLIIKKTIPDPTGWIVEGVNNSTEPLRLTVYAVCLHNSTGTTRIASAQASASGSPRVLCGNTELAIGGGYSFDSNSLGVYISTPSDGGWDVYANGDAPINVYVICLSGSGLKRMQVRDNAVDYGPGDNSLHFTLTCPSGYFMTAGGYEGRGTYTSRIDPANAGVWEVQVESKVYFDGSLDHAICLTEP